VSSNSPSPEPVITHQGSMGNSQHNMLVHGSITSSQHVGAGEHDLLFTADQEIELGAISTQFEVQ